MGDCTELLELVEQILTLGPQPSTVKPWPFSTWRNCPRIGPDLGLGSVWAHYEH